MSTVSQTLVSNKSLLKAVSLAFASKACEKDGDRDELPDGSEFDCEVTLLARVDGEEYRYYAAGRLAVGHPSQRAGTVDSAGLLGWILEQVPDSHREPMIDRLLEVYEADGEFPVSKASHDKATKVLQRMRARNQTTARGSVSVKLQQRAKLAIVG